jgi:gliding motility-associated lipoprotein GldH
MTKLFFTLGILLTLLSGCVQSPYYQKSFEMPGNKWSHSFAPSFDLEIVDTSVYYNMHFIIRHTNNYAYSNIWLNVLVKEPGDSVFSKTRLEIPLAEPQGKWLGNGMGEIFEQRRMIILDHNAIPITDDLIAISESSLPNLFRKKGRYTIQLQQNMRDNVLSDILHVGLRIEKSTNRKTNTVK